MRRLICDVSLGQVQEAGYRGGAWRAGGSAPLSLRTDELPGRDGEQRGAGGPSQPLGQSAQQEPFLRHLPLTLPFHPGLWQLAGWLAEQPAGAGVDGRGGGGGAGGREGGGGETVSEGPEHEHARDPAPWAKSSELNVGIERDGKPDRRKGRSSG